MARERRGSDFYGVAIGSADTIEIPLDPNTILRMHSKVLPDSGRPEEIVEGTLSDLQPLLERLVSGAQRWVFAHPQNPLYDKWIPTLPPRGPRLASGETLIEMATAMRIAYEDKPKRPPSAPGGMGRVACLRLVSANTIETQTFVDLADAALGPASVWLDPP